VLSGFGIQTYWLRFHKRRLPAEVNNPVRLEQKNLKVVHTVQVPSELAIQHLDHGNEKRYLFTNDWIGFPGSTEYFPG